MPVILRLVSGRRGQCSWLPRQAQQTAFPAKLTKHPSLLEPESSRLKFDRPGKYTMLLQSLRCRSGDPKKAGLSVCRSEMFWALLSLIMRVGDWNTRRFRNQGLVTKTHFKMSLSEGNAAPRSPRILSICSFDMKGYGADDICKPNNGMRSFLITSCSPSTKGSPACVSSLRNAAILFWPRYLLETGSLSSESFS